MPLRHRTGPADWLTIPGRLLLMMTVLGFGGVLYLLLTDTLDILPAGNYPLALWLVPAGVVAFFAFFVAAFILERLGVQIYRRKAD